MTALQLPCTIFQTRHRMNDYGARDMRCGDLSAQQLQHQYHLANVSAKVDPYRLKKRLPFTPSQYQFGDFYHQEDTIPLQECSKILFDEFRSKAHFFSFYGPYRELIIKLIDHMQYRHGEPFGHLWLDLAMRNRIIQNRPAHNTLKMIKDTLLKNIDWTSRSYPHQRIGEFHKNISRAPLPKFTQTIDTINGMGLSTHDTWSTHIILNRLEIIGDEYHAKIHFKIQDHFGLDDSDIFKYHSRHLSMFGIWFVLQRYNKFGFRPFMTNMSVTIDIHGNRNESR